MPGLGASARRAGRAARFRSSAPRSPTALLASLLVAAAAALAPGCGRAPAGDHVSTAAPPGGPAAARSGGFVERGDSAGLERVNVSGDPAHRDIIEANGPGLCSLDFDRDGDEDLYVVNGQLVTGAREARSTLYRNLGQLRFEDVTEGSGTGDDGWGFGCAVADYDQDGLPDLYVAAHGPDRLYHNLGDGRFEEASRAAGMVDEAWGTSAAWGDYDRDGLPDLYVANYLVFPPRHPVPQPFVCSYRELENVVFCGPRGLVAEPDTLYRNRGDGSFEDVSRSSGVRDAEPGYGQAVVFADLDADGLADIFVANDSSPNHAFLNTGHERFVEAGLRLGLAVNAVGKPQASMGIAWGDADEDGRDDVFVTAFSDDTNTLFRNEGIAYIDATTESGLGPPSFAKLAWGTFFFDCDHDGHLDLFVANGHIYPQVEGSSLGLEYAQANQLFRGDGRGRFAAIEAGALTRDRRLSRGAIAFDPDRDGDLDVAVVELHARPSLYENRAAALAWVEPLLEGRDCNRDALGAVAEAELEGHRLRRTVLAGGSYASASQLRLHLGLGAASGLEALHVTWPCGRRESFRVAASSFPTLVEGTGRPAPAAAQPAGRTPTDAGR